MLQTDTPITESRFDKKLDELLDKKLDKKLTELRTSLEYRLDIRNAELLTSIEKCLNDQTRWVVSWMTVLVIGAAWVMIGLS